MDDASLTQPDAHGLLGGRDSPPPLGELLGMWKRKVEGEEERVEVDDAKGWWLGDSPRVWIGVEERRLMRLWAGVVVRAIDGHGEENVAWGSGALSWDV